MRTRVGITMVCVSSILAGCSLFGIDDSACPETVTDEAGGVADGIDLASPGWLPPGFPLPDGISIRHLNSGTSTGARLMTGFIPGGDAATVVGRTSAAFEASGYEILLAADGFLPITYPAIAAFDEESDLVVWVDASPQRQQARVDGTCPPQDGAQVGFLFEPVTVGEARRRFAGSSLTQGSALAKVAGREFAAQGECFAFDGDYTFGAVGGDQIAIQFDTSSVPVFGSANVDAEGSAVFNVDLDRSGVTPRFEVTDSGFSVDAMFIDGLGDLGVVPGRIDVTCAW